MLTKITLTIDGQERELGPDCVKNWDDVLCTYKRSDFSGVVRQFTSKFEFVNDAYDMLLEAYLANQFMADVKVAIYLIDNNWIYHKHFECPLDFSSVQIENRVFSVSAVDNSLAALIKANKGTKYEFNVGSEIVPDSTFHFDRLPMAESVTYAFSNGTTNEQTGALNVAHPASQETIMMGNVASEICINRTILWNEDQTEDEDSFVLQAIKEVDVRLDFSVVEDLIGSYGDPISIRVQHINQSGTEIYAIKEIGSFGGKGIRSKYLGTLYSENQLPTLTGGSEDDGKYYIIDGIVYVASYKGSNPLKWENTHKSEKEYALRTYSDTHTFHMSPRDKLRFRVYGGTTNNVTAGFRIVSSRFKFSWKARGETCDIPAFKPINVLNKILEKICTDKLTVTGEIDMTDTRLRRTCLLGAESIRGISGAKFYTSFTEFCNWMETVYGYTYYVDTDEVNKVVFVPRSRMFNDDANIKIIEDAVDVKYNINSAAIYSTIEIGYDKKDYDSANGRDEFNFTHTYSTGCSASDKKLSLISKYRADCYGIEFAAQKRGKNTTDTTTDNDVFFVLCISEGDDMYADRSDIIGGALNDAVFNAAYSPINCVMANAGYIGLQADVLTLSFASSTGNSKITINGVPISSDLTLDTPLLTTGELEFTTGDLETPNTDDLVQVVVRGIKYVGFIKEVEENYGREAAAKYKLLVKSMEL